MFLFLLLGYHSLTKATYIQLVLYACGCAVFCRSVGGFPGATLFGLGEPGREVRWPGEELGEVDEYDQNILYSIPKQLIKSKRERQFKGKGVYSGSQLRGTGYSREQEVEAAGHIQSTTRKQKVMKACSC